MNCDVPPKLSAGERSAWTVFLRSLFHRTSENLRGTIASGVALFDEALESAKDRYPSLRGSSDPENFDDYKANLTPAEKRGLVLGMLPTIMTNPSLGQFFNDMPTRVFTLPSGSPDFLLSDDPLARTNGLKKMDGHFAIPISPRKLFVSAWNENTLNIIGKMKPDEIVGNMNKWTVESARFFVVSRDRSQDRFIRNRFGISPKDSVMR